MANRRFEVFEYRQVLVRMRQGDSDRDIVRGGLMGRKKLTTVRRQSALRQNGSSRWRPVACLAAAHDLLGFEILV